MSNEGMDRRSLLRTAGIGAAAGVVSLPAITAITAVPAFAQQATGITTVVVQLDPTGEPNSSGTITLEFNFNTNMVSWSFPSLQLDSSMTALHIHTGGPGVNGGVFIGFTPDLTGSVGSNAADMNTVLNNKNGHYVNLHTANAGGGAIRGQVDNAPVMP